MAVTSEKPFRLGTWLVEPDLNRLSSGEHSTHLEPKTMEVLVYLCGRPGEVVAADTIIAEVWGGRPMGDNPVYKSIAKLRRALNDDPNDPRYIATVPKKGYRLIGAVSRSPRNRRADDQGGVARSTLRRLTPIAAGLVLGVALAAAFFWQPQTAPVTIRPVSTFAGSHSQPSFAPDGQSFAFINNSGGEAHVWLLNPGEAAPRQLTDGPFVDSRPRWSPDGRTILFMRGGSVWSIPSGAGAAVELLREASNPNWSRDGKRIVFERRYEVWTADADGGNQARVGGVPRRELTLAPRWPAFSPDGRRIVYFESADTPEGDLWIVESDGGEPERITFAPALGGAPVWTPDGGRVVYSSQRGGGRTLWQVDVADKSSTALLTGSGDDDFPDISADGNAVIYSNSRERFVLVESDLLNGPERELHESRLPLLGPELSPDSGTIALFGGARTGGFQIFTLPASGGPPLMITSDPSATHAIPRWSPDGASLYFYLTRKATDYSRVDVVAGVSETVVPGWTWNVANGAAPDPSGRRIIYSRLAGQAPIQTLIRNLDTGNDDAFYATLEYPRWSADGKRVIGSLFTGQRFPGDVAVCPVDGDTCRTIAENARIPMWSADESRVFFVRGFGESQELFVVNADGTGTERRIMEMSPLFPLGPFYSVTSDDSILWIRHEKERGAIWIAE